MIGKRQASTLFSEVKGLNIIGKGSFTTCFDNSDKVYLVSNDPIKECIALGWFPECELIPEIERLDYEGEYSLYTMKKYEKVTAPKKQLNTKAYKLYLDFRRIANNLLSDVNLWDKQKKLNQEIKTEKLISLCLDSCSNYTSKAGFEISPRNIASNEGNLILLDCFFDINKLKRY